MKATVLALLLMLVGCAAQSIPLTPYEETWRKVYCNPALQQNVSAEDLIRVFLWAKEKGVECLWSDAL